MLSKPVKFAAAVAIATAMLLVSPTIAVSPAQAGPQPPGIHGSGTAIVVLGYGLQPNGAMQPELVRRLGAGYVQAVLAPGSPIIVTGGNPRNGITEARAMAGWLIGRGIPASRVIVEPAAVSTAENAKYAGHIMRTIGARDAVVITSANHIDRAVSSFMHAGVNVAAALTPEQVPPFVWALGPLR